MDPLTLEELRQLDADFERFGNSAAWAFPYVRRAVRELIALRETSELIQRHFAQEVEAHERLRKAAAHFLWLMERSGYSLEGMKDLRAALDQVTQAGVKQ